MLRDRVCESLSDVVLGEVMSRTYLQGQRCVRLLRSLSMFMAHRHIIVRFVYLLSERLSFVSFLLKIVDSSAPGLPKRKTARGIPEGGPR